MSRQIDPRVAEIMAAEGVSEATARRRAKGVLPRDPDRLVEILRAAGVNVIGHGLYKGERQVLVIPSDVLPLYKPGSVRDSLMGRKILGDRTAPTTPGRPIRLKRVYLGAGIEVRNAVATTVVVEHRLIDKVYGREVVCNREQHYCQIVRETLHGTHQPEGGWIARAHRGPDGEWVVEEKEELPRTRMVGFAERAGRAGCSGGGLLYRKPAHGRWPEQTWEWLTWGPWGEIIRATWWNQYVEQFRDGSPYRHHSPADDAWRLPLVKPAEPSTVDQFLARYNLTKTRQIAAMTLGQLRAQYAKYSVPFPGGRQYARWVGVPLSPPTGSEARYYDDSEEAKETATEVLVEQAIHTPPERKREAPTAIDAPAELARLRAQEDAVVAKWLAARRQEPQQAAA